LLRFDTRGHGASEAPVGQYAMDQLAADAHALLDALGIERFHFVGLSMGGMIGQQLALRIPLRMATLTLADTTSRYPAEARSVWEQRIALVRAQGMGALVPTTLERWFTAAFRERHIDTVAGIAARIRATPVAGYIGCAHAISRIDLTARLTTRAHPRRWPKKSSVRSKVRGWKSSRRRRICRTSSSRSASMRCCVAF
jgi:3-oxoadipate enol-lactonase